MSILSDFSWAMFFHKLCVQGSLPYFFLMASFYTWKGCVSSLFSYHLTGSLCWNDHLWLLLNLFLRYCLPRQSACLSLMLCKLVFSYLPEDVMRLWPGKSDLHNSNLPLSLFIILQFTCLPQTLSAEVLPHCLVHQWTNWIVAKRPQPLGITAKCGCPYWWLQWSLFWDQWKNQFLIYRVNYLTITYCTSF